jgi:hypothetical protein
MRFAIFANRKRARAAERNVDSTVEGDVELLTQPEQLSVSAISMPMTMARAGAIIGASSVAGSALLLLAALAWLDPGVASPAALAPYATIAVVVTLAAVLGGLAGSLSFTSQARPKIERLREHLGYGHSVLLIESDRDISKLLHNAGAVQTGTLA